MSFISTKVGQFSYFDAQLGRPHWAGKRVLDFGGNVGNLLAEPRSAIDHDKYWCLDVSRDAIEEGRRRYPEAHWIFYNRYNFEFNPEGIERLGVPDSGQRFDYILAYSVFTHTSQGEMIELVHRLETFLDIGGRLVFTFLDPHWVAFDEDLYPGSNLRWRLQKRKEINPAIDVEALLEKAKNAQWCTLVNDDDLYLDDEDDGQRNAREKKAYVVLCTPEYMKTLFPDGEIKPPTKPERHHCCIIRK